MDQSDFRVELERMHSASFGWALCCCNHRREEAEEALQTAYLKALQGTASFHGESSLRTWFFAVIRRTAMEQGRRQWLRRRILDKWLARELSPQPASDPEVLACESESCRMLLRALEELSARQREVLHLVFYQDLTVEQASSVLHLSVGTARTHFDRGKRQLRKALAQLEVQFDRR
jgi:RNA polymerase sigma-70 factor (ECF subfamily)